VKIPSDRLVKSKDTRFQLLDKLRIEYNLETMRIAGLLIVTLTSVLIGALVGRNSIRSGRYFINVLIGTAAFGPLMYGGFTWYDETFLFGLLGVMFYRRIEFPFNEFIKTQKIYFAFLVYFLFEFLNGVYFFYNNNEEILRKFRWLIYLFLLLLVATLGSIDRSKKLEVTNKHLWLIISFLTVYLTWNYLVLRETGSAGYAQYAQVPERGYLDAIWANTAYVTLSVFIFMYIGMIGITQKSSKINLRLSKLVLSISTLIFGLTLSRGGFFLTFLILGAFLVSQKGWKSPAKSFLLLLLITFPMIIGLNVSGKGNLQGFISDIKATVLVPFDENRAIGRESDRIQQYTEINSLIKSPAVESTKSPAVESTKSPAVESKSLFTLNNLFGYGLRTSGLVLSMANEESDQSKYSMSFAPSIPIEFGFIGIIILLLAILEGIKILFRSNSKDKLLVLTLILGTILTTTVVNNFDYIALYMLLSGSKYLTRTD
jgi:hypothetical protein